MKSSTESVLKYFAAHAQISAGMQFTCLLFVRRSGNDDDDDVNTVFADGIWQVKYCESDSGRYRISKQTHSTEPRHNEDASSERSLRSRMRLVVL